MSKWADYVITCVEYDRSNKISIVGVYVDEPGDRSNRRPWRRDQVVEGLENEKTFVTAFIDGGKWKKGAEVRRRKIHGEWFIQTVPNEKAEDNLGELPECS